MEEQKPPGFWRKLWIEHLRKALAKTPGARYYAIASGSPEELALAAALCEHQSRGNEIFPFEDAANFLSGLKPFAGSMFQLRPEPDPEPPTLTALEQWKDPFGNLPQNPFL